MWRHNLVSLPSLRRQFYIKIEWVLSEKKKAFIEKRSLFLTVTQLIIHVELLKTGKKFVSCTLKGLHVFVLNWRQEKKYIIWGLSVHPLPNTKHRRCLPYVVFFSSSSFQNESWAQVWENAGRQWPRGVGWANRHAIIASTLPRQTYCPNYHRAITHIFPLPILIKCHGDVFSTWNFSSSNGAAMG